MSVARLRAARRRGAAAADEEELLRWTTAFPLRLDNSGVPREWIAMAGWHSSVESINVGGVFQRALSSSAGGGACILHRLRVGIGSL
mmetsp:Transcript_35171/g.74271  ORF Transcript_35171/g.74271 Transcript_35171/m.74271 type:complete len:87 (-) Transcript_35171:13-273(-)